MNWFTAAFLRRAAQLEYDYDTGRNSAIVFAIQLGFTGEEALGFVVDARRHSILSGQPIDWKKLEDQMVARLHWLVENTKSPHLVKAEEDAAWEAKIRREERILIANEIASHRHDVRNNQSIPDSFYCRIAEQIARGLGPQSIKGVDRSLEEE